MNCEIEIAFAYDSIPSEELNPEANVKERDSIRGLDEDQEPMSSRLGN